MNSQCCCGECVGRAVLGAVHLGVARVKGLLAKAPPPATLRPGRVLAALRLKVALHGPGAMHDGPPVLLAPLPR